MSSATLRVPILAAVHAALRPLGYRKSAAMFLRHSQDVVHIIEVQGAGSNTVASAKFTVNVGVFAADLAEPGNHRDAGQPSLPAAHWRERLGYLSPEHTDIWWTVSTKEEAQAAAEDVAERIATYAIPALKKLHNCEALLALWQSGQSPGLTEQQRNEYVAKLQSRVN